MKISKKLFFNSIPKFKAFGIDEYVGGVRWVFVFTLLFLYGLSHIPQMYLLSYFFQVSATGFASLVAWNIISSNFFLSE